MIAELKPYPEYKESGLPWLGRVPGHWRINRAKSIFRCVDERSKTGKEELLTVSSARGVVPRKTANVTMFKAESYLGYKMCWPGDLVINSLWAWAGGLGVSPHHGIISSAYGVYRVREYAAMRPDFVNAVVRSSPFNWELKVRSKGVWISRLQITDISFLDTPIHIPPPTEQEAIVRFLDWASGRLERAIRAKRKVIALLTEQKQAIIHRAVTRGLDPNVPLKPSGIPWLGDIPTHWEVLRARFLFRAVTRRDTQKDDPKLSVTQRRGLVPTDEMEENSTQARNYDRFQVCHPQDLVLNKYKAHLGVFCCAFQRGLITPNYTVFRPTRELYTHFFDILFHTTTYRNEFTMMVYGVTEGMSPLYTQDFYRVPVLFPPVAEQKTILEEVAVLTRQQNNAISRLEREIELLREYRTRLVADVVTGKLDVREAAAQLPSETVVADETPALADADEPDELVEAAEQA